MMNIQGGSSTSPTKLSNGSKEGSSGKTKEAKREGKEKLKVTMMVMSMLEKMVMLVLEKMISKIKIHSDDHGCGCRFQNHLPRQNVHLVCLPPLVLTCRCALSSYSSSSSTSSSSSSTSC